MQHHRLLIVLVLLLAPMFAMAQDKPASTTPLPEWDQLTSAQRNDLIAPLRDRWKTMPTDTRQRAHHGMQRWEKMSPEQRQHAQSLFHAMRQMDNAEREAFLAKWHAMTPQQRNDWVAAHPAPARRHGPGRD